MAFRPTIAVTVNKEIADIGYYRNWAVEDLFIEALGLAVLYEDCRTLEEVRDRAFGTQKIGYFIEPEVLENTQENLRWIEGCSEFPISVDLTLRAIYMGASDADDEFVAKKPGIEDICLWPGTITEDFYWNILSKYKICFDKADMDCVRELFMTDDEILEHLSSGTAEKIRKKRNERTGGPDDETGIH